MNTIPAWKWDPDQFQPEFISGPDFIMRDSLYAFYIRSQPSVMFQARTQKTDKPCKNCVICEPLNFEQKLAFLTLHLQKRGYHEYKATDLSRYAHIVRCIESVHVIVCMLKSGVLPSADHRSKTSMSLKMRLRAIEGFPAGFMSFLSYTESQGK